VYISLNDAAAKGEPGPRTRKGMVRVSSTVVTLGIVSMLTDISSESVAAILPIYITGALGFGTVAYGVIDGIYQGVSAVVRIGGGYLSDRADRPKWVAFIGYGLSAIVKVWLLVASGFAAIATVIALDRIGKGIRTAPRDALITASSQPETLGRSFGVHRTLDNIGAAVGPLLAFLILWLVPSGFVLIFVASLVCAAIGVIILGLLVPDRRPRREQAATGAPRAPLRLRDLGDPRLRRVVTVAGILAVLTVGDGFVYLSLQAQGGLAAQFFPLLYVGTNVAFVAFAVPVGRLADRIGRGRAFVFGHLALLAAYLCTLIPVGSEGGTAAIVTPGGIAVLVAALLLLGAFYAATDGVLAALAGQFSPEGGTATGIAGAQTAVAVGRLVSAAGFGILWAVIGREPAMAIVAVLLAVGVPVAYRVLRPVLGSRTA
jgi:MFS family permease